MEIRNVRGDVADTLAKKKPLAPVKWEVVAPHKQRERPQVVLKRLCLKRDCIIADLCDDAMCMIKVIQPATYIDCVFGR